MTIDIPVKVRQVRENAIAVANGTEAEFTDPRTGEVRTREKWFWLPKRYITVEPEDFDVDSNVIVTLPKWIAKDRGLENEGTET